MASKDLSKRENWQTESGQVALEAEDLFAISIQGVLDELYPDTFVVDQHPKEFGDLYSTHELPSSVREKIYDLDVTEKAKNGNLKYKWGISMDFAIRNKKNGKTLFGEIKRQNGWVEGKESKDGRGNAHERSNKYFAPGLLKAIRDESKISDEILPFFVVFMGDITRDPRRNREISFWYQGYESNYYMWRDTSKVDELTVFFKENLLPYLV